MALQTKKRLKANLKFRIFLLFLILSIVFWLLINLSKTYTSDVIFEVSYVNLPKDRVIQNEPIKEIRASINSSGFNLLRYKLKRKTLKLDISNLAYKKGVQYYYLPNNHLSILKKQLNVDTMIDRIIQDTIFINLGINLSKKVPVKLLSDISFKSGYNYTDTIQITPDSITIIGPEAKLDTINYVLTDNLLLTEVSNEIDQNITLQNLNSSGIALSDLKVNIKAKVDKFTEGKLEISFKIKNIPSDYIITTFPNKVTVVYQVALSNFNKITKDDFEVECDFKQTQSNELDYLIPILKEKSSLITTVNIVPNKIDFLIEK